MCIRDRVSTQSTWGRNFYSEMLGYIALVLIPLIAFGLRWFMQPYLNWRKQRAGTKPEVLECITKSGRTTMKEHLAKNPGKKTHLSLVIPAFNEEERIGVMLTEALDVQHLLSLAI
eukprot:TRINITY_DN5905_c0_g1_i1.p2 TRINITY_DN5905_c0_g1~~TRINITY_DN5905_c0_g1_i1.p2  ORF type:complete len:136 (+),score=32.23 TRINITY_DN5905_c0_g1_i1:61-408(+)